MLFVHYQAITKRAAGTPSTIDAAANSSTATSPLHGEPMIDCVILVMFGSDFSLGKVRAAAIRLRDQVASPTGIAVIGGLTAVGLSLKVS